MLALVVVDLLPDAWKHAAVGDPLRLTSDPRVARGLLDLVRTVPTPVWGRDELQAGGMWNSNSMIAWLIASAGLPTDQLRPPLRGRAPGWNAGLEVARRSRASARRDADAGQAIATVADRASCYVPGSTGTTTGHRALRATSPETLPCRSRPKRPRPWVPTTSRSSCRLASASWSAAGPGACVQHTAGAVRASPDARDAGRAPGPPSRRCGRRRRRRCSTTRSCCLTVGAPRWPTSGSGRSGGPYFAAHQAHATRSGQNPGTKSSAGSPALNEETQKRLLCRRFFDSGGTLRSSTGDPAVAVEWAAEWP
jgi:hypothetical protein